jgi:Rod binding domain-containing protein
MESANLILTQPVSPPSPLEHFQMGGSLKAEGFGDGSAKTTSKLRLKVPPAEQASDEKKIQIAKDFESILITKLLDQMKNTIGDWGFEKDSASSQVQGIFWLYLAQDIGNNGGMGLWKDIHKFLAGNEQPNAAVKSLDGRL